MPGSGVLREQASHTETDGVWRRREPSVVERADVNAASGVLFDIHEKLARVVTLLEDDGDEEESDSDS
jgi:hypothetical protein